MERAKNIENDPKVISDSVEYLAKIRTQPVEPPFADVISNAFGVEKVQVTSDEKGREGLERNIATVKLLIDHADQLLDLMAAKSKGAPTDAVIEKLNAAGLNSWLERLNSVTQMRIPLAYRLPFVLVGNLINAIGRMYPDEDNTTPERIHATDEAMQAACKDIQVGSISANATPLEGHIKVLRQAYNVAGARPVAQHALEVFVPHFFANLPPSEITKPDIKQAMQRVYEECEAFTGSSYTPDMSDANIKYIHGVSVSLNQALRDGELYSKENAYNKVIAMYQQLIVARNTRYIIDGIADGIVAFKQVSQYALLSPAEQTKLFPPLGVKEISGTVEAQRQINLLVAAGGVDLAELNQFVQHPSVQEYSAIASDYKPLGGFMNLPHNNDYIWGRSLNLTVNFKDDALGKIGALGKLGQSIVDEIAFVRAKKKNSRITIEELRADEPSRIQALQSIIKRGYSNILSTLREFTETLALDELEGMDKDFEWHLPLYLFDTATLAVIAWQETETQKKNPHISSFDLNETVSINASAMLAEMCASVQRGEKQTATSNNPHEQLAVSIMNALRTHAVTLDAPAYCESLYAKLLPLYLSPGENNLDKAHKALATDLSAYSLRLPAKVPITEKLRRQTEANVQKSSRDSASYLAELEVQCTQLLAVRNTQQIVSKVAACSIDPIVLVQLRRLMNKGAFSDEIIRVKRQEAIEERLVDWVIAPAAAGKGSPHPHASPTSDNKHSREHVEDERKEQLEAIIRAWDAGKGPDEQKSYRARSKFKHLDDENQYHLAILTERLPSGRTIEHAVGDHMKLGERAILGWRGEQAKHWTEVFVDDSVGLKENNVRRITHTGTEWLKILEYLTRPVDKLHIQRPLW